MVLCLRTAMNWPSGVQAGLASSVSFVIFFGSLPSGFTIHTSAAPPRSLMNAMAPPSGEKVGCMSQDMPLVIAFAFPPVIGRT